MTKKKKTAEKEPEALATAMPTATEAYEGYATPLPAVIPRPTWWPAASARPLVRATVLAWGDGVGWCRRWGARAAFALIRRLSRNMTD